MITKTVDTQKSVSLLSDEELRIKVANLLGWSYVNPNDWKTELQKRGYREWIGAPTNAGHLAKIYAFAHDLPDYCHDLEAMHEAELQNLSYEPEKPNRGTFWDNVHEIVKGREFWSDDTTNASCFDVMHATARQRAEAFVLTMGESETDSVVERNVACALPIPENPLSPPPASVAPREEPDFGEKKR